MKKIKFTRGLITMFTLVTLCFIVSGFMSRFGLDSYEFYLNNKLILRQTVNQPLNLRVLQLNHANENDQLRIKYTHCTIKGAGTGRSIILKDEHGKTIKEWAFADAKGDDLTMAISVKELLQLEKAHAQLELSFYYVARELPRGEMLSLLKF